MKRLLLFQILSAIFLVASIVFEFFKGEKMYVWQTALFALGVLCAIRSRIEAGE